MSRSTKGLLPTLRQKIITQMGGRCETCGFSADPRLLQIMHQDKSYLSQNRYSFYFGLLEGGDYSKCRLLCVNCKFAEMWDKRGLRKAAPVGRVVVWQTSLSVYETVERFRWMEPYLEEGAEMLVVPDDQRVYKHGETLPLADSWGEYAQGRGLQGTLGDEPVVVLG